MCSANLNQKMDPRTVQATGPFRLDPGAINELIIGVTWVPDQVYPCPDLRECVLQMTWHKLCSIIVLFFQMDQMRQISIG
jgi:hypothetical protein